MRRARPPGDRLLVGAALAAVALGASAAAGAPSAPAALAPASSPLATAALIQEGAKLTGGGESGAGRFGFDVALSSDGNTAVVGAPFDGDFAGAAWVFTRSGDTWTQEGPKLTGGAASATAEFGFSVALSADGSTALVGAPGDNGFAGAAWVFTRSAGTWAQQGAKLTGAGASGVSVFGFGVALSADGNTALIGGPLDNSFTGAAWAFTRSGETWTQQGAKLTGGDETGTGRFGGAVALSADGSTALVGGSDDNGTRGAAWAFTRSGAAWTQQGGKLTGSDETGAGRFGSAVALSADGSTALLGGSDDDGSRGAAWAFIRSAGVWTQQGGKLTGSDETGAGRFGMDVALAADGSTGLVGGAADSSSQGAAWSFTRTGAAWAQQGTKLTGGDETGAGELGSAVALSADAATALVGGPVDAAEAGAAWAFTVPATVPGAPTGVLAAADDARATVTWLAPASDGGAAITSYVVTPFVGAAAQTPVAVGPATSTTVTGLTNDTTYTFTVTAVNSAGSGPASAASNPVTPSIQGRPLPDPPPAATRPPVPELTVTTGVRPPRPPAR